ncbi:glycosyltransferase [Haloferula rosea]|uniref:Glycosyltransferase n=1 Tax=Haloferula rosea TaxID=490093 RepID=A0A934R7M6_9BACT|nr:glycosyltransferase [Haloferula rosea]MBK1825428.1 glycosyltransferase [Haloferula rosea]
MKSYLWITRQDPRPADSGELIYTLGLIRALAATGEVRLTVLGHRAGDSESDIEGVSWDLPSSIASKSPLSLLSRLPSDAHRLADPRIRDTLRWHIGSATFDGIIIDQAANAWALDDLPEDLPVFYVSHNHEAIVRTEIAGSQEGALPLRLALRFDASKYAALERRLCATAKVISAITPRDESHYRDDFPDKHYCQLPPGFEGEIPSSPERPITEETPRRVVLAGTFEWIAKRRNLEAFLHDAESLFEPAGIEFHVVGKAKPDYFESLSQRHPWARFIPNVPSMAPHLRDARIGLIPEALGGGFKLKALDYIFHGLPLASIGSALSGLPLTPGANVIAAGTTRELASQIATRIDDLEHLNHLAESALARCQKAFDWADRGRTLAAALRKL